MGKDLNVLKSMLEEIEFLQNDMSDVGRESFLNDERLKRSVSMTLINLGELANHLSKEFKKANGHIPFRGVIDLRNVAAHKYKTLRFEFIWNLVQKDIPSLKEQIEKIINS